MIFLLYKKLCPFWTRPYVAFDLEPPEKCEPPIHHHVISEASLTHNNFNPENSSNLPREISLSVIRRQLLLLEVLWKQSKIRKKRRSSVQAKHKTTLSEWDGLKAKWKVWRKTEKVCPAAITGEVWVVSAKFTQQSCSKARVLSVVTVLVYLRICEWFWKTKFRQDNSLKATIDWWFGICDCRKLVFVSLNPRKKSEISLIKSKIFS